MAYEGLQFIYDGIPSQRYGLMFAFFDSADYKHAGGSENNLTIDKATRSQRHTLLSVSPDDPLEYDIEVVALKPLQPYEVNAVHAWLCGQLGFKKLVIQAPEYAGMHFNCVFNEPDDYYIKAGTNGFNLTMTCDAGGAWSDAKTVTFTPTDGGTITVNNRSASYDYLYPTVEFTLDGGTEFSIINTTDSVTREFKFTELADGETITVNGRTGEVMSSLSTIRINHFNAHFLRLVHGLNTLKCTGKVSNLKLTYENFIRIGG